MKHAETLETLVRQSDSLMTVLRAARELDLPDWLIFSGAVYQKVLNHLTGRPEDYGLKDYDLAYFDASDLSWEAEDLVIRRAAAELPPPLDRLVEVRNQARVHLWFEGRFGEPYDQLSCSTEALDRFVSTTNAVGVRLEADDRLTIAAPFGLEDLFGLCLRPNPNRPVEDFRRKVSGVLARWPELKVEDGLA
jgi:hypothetical protein